MADSVAVAWGLYLFLRRSQVAPADAQGEDHTWIMAAFVIVLYRGWDFFWLK